MSGVNNIEIPDTQMQCAIVLVVDDDATTNDFLVQALSPFYRVFSAESGEEAIGFCANHAPDLVILDVVMPGIDGLLTCKMLKTIPSMQNCPILLSSADTTVEQELNCWDAGATDVVSKPIVIPTLAKRMNAHIRAKLLQDQRDNMVFVDPQSGLYNRRYFEDCYEKQISLANRNNGPLSLVIFEIVNKSLNDDALNVDCLVAKLQQLSQVVKENLSRPTDTLVRYSESELAVLLPDTYVFGAKHIVQNVLQTITGLEQEGPHELINQLDVHAGMASLDAIGKNLTLIEQAKKNLQQNLRSWGSNTAQYYQ